jgi:hypothetical protein
MKQTFSRYELKEIMHGKSLRLNKQPEAEKSDS